MKKINQGKVFENDFKRSVPKDIYVYRYKDGTASWGNNDMIDVHKLNMILRPYNCPVLTEDQLKAKGVILPPKTTFQSKNICDFDLYLYPNKFHIELKSLKGKSYAFAKPSEKSKLNQIKELTSSTKHKGIYAGLLINFRDVEETYYISIEQYNEFERTLTSKSIPIKLFREHCILVHQEKKQVNWKYYIGEMLNNIIE